MCSILNKTILIGSQTNSAKMRREEEKKNFPILNSLIQKAFTIVQIKFYIVVQQNNMWKKKNENECCEKKHSSI